MAMTGMTRDELLSALGRELHDALVRRRPVDPLAMRGHGLTLEEAYRIQHHMLAHRIANGVRVVGKKIGATSEPVQKAVGIDQPDFGLLLDDCAYRSGDEIPYNRLIQPRAEGEIAFFLGRDLTGPGVTAQDVLDATDYVSPCLEIVDSRIRDWRIGIVDTVADNASCGVFILGEDRIDPADLDLAACAMTMSVNGAQATRGVGAASLGHPARAVAWLANTFGELGETLTAGEPVLSGSLGALIDIHPDDEVRLEIDGIGACSARFTRRPK